MMFGDIQSELDIHLRDIDRVTHKSTIARIKKLQGKSTQNTDSKELESQLEKITAKISEISPLEVDFALDEKLLEIEIWYDNRIKSHLKNNHRSRVDEFFAAFREKKSRLWLKKKLIASRNSFSESLNRCVDSSKKLNEKFEIGNLVQYRNAAIGIVRVAVGGFSLYNGNFFGLIHGVDGAQAVFKSAEDFFFKGQKFNEDSELVLSRIEEFRSQLSSLIISDFKQDIAFFELLQQETDLDLL